MAYNWSGLGQSIGQGVADYLGMKMASNPNSLQNKMMQNQLIVQALAPYRAYKSLSPDEQREFLTYKRNAAQASMDPLTAAIMQSMGYNIGGRQNNTPINTNNKNTTEYTFVDPSDPNYVLVTTDVSEANNFRSKGLKEIK